MKSRPSDGTARIARQAAHDLALGVVREQATVAREIARDFALGAVLLGRNHGVEDPPPERLALDSGFCRRRNGGAVRVGECAHDGLVFCDVVIVFATFRSPTSRPFPWAWHGFLSRRRLNPTKVEMDAL